MISAYQKCVRRGLTDWALRLANGFLSFDEKQWAYFRRRVCVIAAEDVGYGDLELTNFVVAWSQISSGKIGLEQMARVWGFLTEQMADAKKSRIFCQLGIVVEMKSDVPDLDEWERCVVEQVKQLPVRSEKDAWIAKNDWRTEKLLRYQLYEFGLKLEEMRSSDLAFETLSGLPDFAHDMHTRSGRAAILKLCQHLPIKEFFIHHPSTDKSSAVGWALFEAEGGKLKDGLHDPRVDQLETKYISARFGWPGVEVWKQLVVLVEEAVQDGKMNELRRSVLMDGERPK